jgi:hypothetical protein
MGRNYPAALAVVAAVAALVTPVAEAKFRASLALKPVRPITRQPVRIIMRIDMVVPKSERLSLIAVGPWRQQSGQGVLNVRLVRTSPRAFKTSVQFPYAGRWRVQVISESGANLIGANLMVRRVRVR